MSPHVEEELPEVRVAPQHEERRARERRGRVRRVGRLQQHVDAVELSEGGWGGS